MTPSPQAIEEYLDQVKDHFDRYDIQLKHDEQTIEQQPADGEQTEVTATRLLFTDTYETEAFFGVRDDHSYVDVIWDFDIIPSLAKAISQDTAEKIETHSETEYTFDDTGNTLIGIIRRLYQVDDIYDEIEGTEMEALADEMEGDFETRVADTHQRIQAARAALGALPAAQVQDIKLRLHREFSAHPLQMEFKTRSDDALLGFRITRQLFPYDNDGVTQADINDAHTIVSNMGKYGERFLKTTFDATTTEPDDDNQEDGLIRHLLGNEASNTDPLSSDSQPQSNPIDIFEDEHDLGTPD